MTAPAEEEVGNYPTDTNENSDHTDEPSDVSEPESGRDPGESSESDVPAEMSGQNESPTLEEQSARKYPNRKRHPPPRYMHVTTKIDLPLEPHV